MKSQTDSNERIFPAVTDPHEAGPIAQEVLHHFVSTPRDPMLDACHRILVACEGTGIDISPIELKKFAILLQLIEQDAKVTTKRGQ